jgi:hypothetical protein
MKKSFLFLEASVFVIFIATLTSHEAKSADTRPGRNPMWHYCTVKVTNQTDSTVRVSYRWEEKSEWQLFRNPILPGEDYTKELPINGGFNTKATLFLKAETPKGGEWRNSAEVKKDQTYSFDITAFGSQEPRTINKPPADPVVDTTRPFRMGPRDSHTINIDLQNLPAGARILVTINSNHPVYKIRAFGPPAHGEEGGPLYQIDEANGLLLDCKTINAGPHKVSLEAVGGDSQKTYEGTVRIRVWEP